MWVLRGLRDGVVTTRWPRRTDPYFASWRGPAAINDDTDEGVALDDLCPTMAIGTRDGRLVLDQGRCIQCGRCVEARPDLFAWRDGSAVAALDRGALLVPTLPETEENLSRIRERLRERTRALGRSVHLRHVDAGSDGTEEWEIAALLNPVYDVHRLGIFFTASPRHADVLLVTGAGTHGMAVPLRRTLEGTPDPKIVIAVGADAVGGGLAAPSYAVTDGIGDIVPVDVWVPGSPPSPFAILHAILLGIGRLT
jgi:Ni,Fe-hydrogenase III small subunit/ferredoxin